MHPMLNIAIRALRKGGNIIAQHYDLQKFNQENTKKNNVVLNNVTHQTYRTMREIIYKSYPYHIVLHDKNFFLKKNEKNIIWIIYPLNGENNFIRNFPHFCISIAIIFKNNIEISAIYDPIRNDLFTAVKGKGAQLNGCRIRCSNINTLKYSTISVNLSNETYSEDNFLSYLDIYRNLIPWKVFFRCTGSTILDLAYVACGKIDCVFHFNISSDDNILPGQLQAREAGCLISDFAGEYGKDINSSSNLTSSPKFLRLIFEKIHKKIVK